MNLQKLAQLNAENPAARIYFAAFATRRRSFTQTNLSDVIDLARRQRILLAPAQVEAFFEGLEAADCGQFIRDEQGARFLWIEKSSAVARAAQQTPQTSENIAAEAPAPAPIVHTLRLRADWMLQLELPPDFSSAEAERVCHFVSALPLELRMEPSIPSMEAK